MTRDGRTYAAATFTEPGRFKATALIGADGLVERVESVFPDPVLGDTPMVTTFTDYKDYGGVKFPSRIAQTAAGHPVLDAGR